MFRIGAVVFLLIAVTLAADFKQARIVDFQDASTIGGGTVTGPSSNGVPVTPTRRVVSSILEVAVTLAVDGKTYTALFEQDSHFQLADLNRGAMIPVRIDGKKIAMQRPSDGKEIKGKVIRVETTETGPSTKSTAN
jgi:hypothetical protein